MAIQLPNGKITRTLPEQVGFNTQKIEEIIKFLNESGLKDLVINLEDMPGVLSADQYLIAEQSPSYIVYDGAVFYKLTEDSDYIDYVLLMDSVSVDSSIVVSTYRIRINRNSLAYNIDSVNLFETYNKTQLDSLLAAKANLSGANFTGAITAPSIIENMTGYTFYKYTALGYTIAYVGVVKNGNKITFAIAGTYEYNSSQDRVDLGHFTIPASIGAKLYPIREGYNWLTLNKVAFYSGYNTKIDADFIVNKDSDTLLTVLTYLSSAVANTKYSFRFEITFLLSDNLAQ